jgi:putative peptidoglycan lipid II flippase
VVVQVIGLVRELFVASQVGLSGQLDALLIALVLPTTLAGLLTSGIQTALVPAYLAARKSTGLDDARRLAGMVLTWVAVIGLALSGLLAAFAGAFSAVAGPGLSPVDRQSAIEYLRILAPLACIAAVTAIMYAVCQAEGRFRALGLSTILGSLVTLAVMLALWGNLGLGGLAIANVAGPIVALGVLIVSALRGSVAPRLVLRASGMDIRGLFRHAAPLTLGSAILQINVIADRAIASLIAPGAVSALRYAEVLIRTPISAISPAWSSAIYPALVHMAQGPDRGSLADITDRMLRYALATFIPVTFLTIAVAPVAVSVAYDRGAFTADDLALTTAVAAAFAPLIVILMTSPVIRLALNARRLGQVLLVGATINVILNTILDVVFGVWLGVAGVALSSSLTAGIVAVYFARRFARSDPDFKLRPIVRSAWLASAASAPAAVLVAALAWSGTYPHGTLPGLLTLTVVGTVGLASYVVLASWFGLEEPRTVVRVVIGRLRRRRTEAAA